MERKSIAYLGILILNAALIGIFLVVESQKDLGTADVLAVHGADSLEVVDVKNLNEVQNQDRITKKEYSLVNSMGSKGFFSAFTIHHPQGWEWVDNEGLSGFADYLTSVEGYRLPKSETGNVLNFNPPAAGTVVLISGGSLDPENPEDDAFTIYENFTKYRAAQVESEFGGICTQPEIEEGGAVLRCLSQHNNIFQSETFLGYRSSFGDWQGFVISERSYDLQSLGQIYVKFNGSLY